MKQLFFYLLLFATPLLTQCDDDNHAVETLPEATQTGRGIFACLVDGKPFIDKSGSPNGISFNCFYQLIDGEYYFGITGLVDNIKIGDFRSINIGTNKKSIIQNFSYDLITDLPGNAWGGGNVQIATIGSEYTMTNDNYFGQVFISKFDLENQIVSGTFWMNLQHPITGDTVKITEGRFDTRFGL